MSIFFCDSNCELWYDKAEKLGLKCIKMPYCLNDEERFYDLGKETDFEAFFDALRKGGDAKTSALNELDYINYFEPYLAQGEDIIYVHFSMQMSGTFESMKKAIETLKGRYPERTIKTANTASISVGAGMIVYEAGQMWANGATDDEIVEWVEQNNQKTAAYFVVEDLNYLKKGGRISPTVAFIGRCLNMKPILNINSDGKIGKVCTAKGFKQGVKTLFDFMEDVGENVADHPICILHADNHEYAEYLRSLIVEKIGQDAEIWVQPIGPVIGSHAGPGTIGLIFHSRCR